MITTIQNLLTAGDNVALVNGLGFVINVTATFFTIGIYDTKGKFYSMTTLEVEGFTFVK